MSGADFTVKSARTLTIACAALMFVPAALCYAAAAGVLAVGIELAARIRKAVG